MGVHKRRRNHRIAPASITGAVFARRARLSMIHRALINLALSVASHLCADLPLLGSAPNLVDGRVARVGSLFGRLLANLYHFELVLELFVQVACGNFGLCRVLLLRRVRVV